MDYGSRRSQVHAPSDSMRQQHGGSTEEGTVHGGGRTGACHSDDEAVADLAREGHCFGDASDGCALGNGVHRRPRTAEKSLEFGSPGALNPEVASGGPVADVGVGVCTRRGFTWRSKKWDHMPKEEVSVDTRMKLLALPLLTPMEWLTDTIHGISDDDVSDDDQDLFNIEHNCMAFADSFWQPVCSSEVDARDIPPARPVADVQLKASVEPVWVSPYPTPVNYQAAEKQVLADLLRLGKIRELGPGHSNAPFFLKMERKSDGSTKARPIVNYTRHGAIFEERQYPIPHIQDVLQRCRPRGILLCWT